MRLQSLGQYTFRQN